MNVPSHIAHCGGIHIVCHVIIVVCMSDHEEVKEIQNPKRYGSPVKLYGCTNFNGLTKGS